MTPAETATYRQGARDVAAIARQAADAIEARATRPLHEGFAVEALRALADEADKLTQRRAPQRPAGEAT